MKFSTLLILLPFSSVALAAANPETTDDIASECVEKYCKDLSTAIIKCSTVNEDPTSQEYLNCACSESIKGDFDKCIGCVPDQSTASQYSDQWNKLCSTYSPNKKSTASSDKTCSWRMFGLAVAGGLIAAM
ncbi:hypothetical protein BGX38DRAFT_1267411 [Terfezia claveryi]|nr:hypothetical protein BGX38DRAFT_1267411 [Terfezia claveryi]